MSLSTGEVVAAAVRVVDAEGDAGLGFNRVARELGIKPPSLYNHVADASDLRRRVAIEGWRLYAELGESAIGRRRGGSALRALGRAYILFAESRPGLFALMSSTRLAPSDADHAPVAARLVTLFRRPLAELGVPERDLWSALRAVRACLHGFVWLRTQGLFAAEEDVEKSFDYLLGLLERGLPAPA